jgi:hypothetical protein
MAEENFQSILNKNIPMPDFNDEVVFTPEHSYGRIFKVIPGQHIR